MINENNEFLNWKTKFIELWNSFLADFPLENLREITLQQYCLGLGKGTFSWYVEYGTQDIGSVSGGSADKFLIYYNKVGNIVFKKLGNTEEQTLPRLRELLFNIAQCAKAGDFEKLKSLEESKEGFGGTILWKIAFLYQDQKNPWIYPFFSRTKLESLTGQKVETSAEGQKLFSKLNEGRNFWEVAFEHRDVTTNPTPSEAQDIFDQDEQNLSNNKNLEEIIRLLQMKRNVILQGAPGTGKTYITPEIVTRLCGRVSNNVDRSTVMSEFKKLIDDERVFFCTFHPSFDYEDFVEGFKPQKNGDGSISIEVTSGILKRICKKIPQIPGINEKSESPQKGQENIFIPANAKVWRIWLGLPTDRDFVTKDCLEKNRIRVGVVEKPFTELTPEEAKGTLDRFYNKMKEGDFVVSCCSKTSINAIGVIKGEPMFDHDLSSQERYGHVRSVQWIYMGEPIEFKEVNGEKTFHEETITGLPHFSPEKMNQLLAIKPTRPDQKNKQEKIYKDSKPIVLIIDEINRGNVAKIFGELITLLEKDKRQGEESEVSVTLPYSKEKFSLPSNLYILATMNTADKSVGNLDYALRRRFAFYRLLPHILDEMSEAAKLLFKEVSGLFVKSIDEADQRSQYLSSFYEPEDVWVGHSYFLESEEANIKDRWDYEIFPILKEYVADGILVDGTEKKITEKLTEISKLIQK